MNETIKNLWNGNIHPRADFDNKILPEIEIKRFMDTHEDFMKKIGSEGRRELFELINSLDEVWRAACENAFEIGFSLGVHLASESLQK